MSDGIRFQHMGEPPQHVTREDLRFFWLLRGFEKLVIKRERGRAGGRGFGDDYSAWLALDRKVSKLRRLLLREVAR